MRDIETIDGELRRLARAWREASHLSYGLGTAHIDEVQGERAETNRLRGWGVIM
jgi:hypothetical protein